jgi:hypothetical protein
MVVDADIPETAPEPPAADARRERQLAILDDLAEAGREIALALKARIVETAAAADPDPASDAECPDLTRAFDRASRATRMAIALSRQVEKDEIPRAPAAPTPARETRAQRAERVLRIVRRITKVEFKEGLLTEALDRAVAERLYDTDISGELLNRSIGELVAGICDDLCIVPPWLALAKEAWAQAEIAERPPGSPYAAWPDLPQYPGPEVDPWSDEFWDPDPDDDVEDEDPEDEDPEDPGGSDP